MEEVRACLSCKREVCDGDCKCIKEQSKTTGKERRKVLPVRCIETGQVFSSCAEADRAFGMKRDSVLRSIKNGRVTKSGYRFEVYKDGKKTNSCLT